MRGVKLDCWSFAHRPLPALVSDAGRGGGGELGTGGDHGEGRTGGGRGGGGSTRAQQGRELHRDLEIDLVLQLEGGRVMRVGPDDVSNAPVAREAVGDAVDADSLLRRRQRNEHPLEPRASSSSGP
eukprot:767990-Hanusia_phi.AAC.1